MIDDTIRERAPLDPPARHERRRRFLANVAARLTAMLLMKMTLVALALILGIGALAVFSRPHPAPPGTPSNGVVLTKLIDIGQFDAADAHFSFNFVYVVHRGFWIFTGESIHVVGTGTDDATVDFSDLTGDQVVRAGATSVSVMLQAPQIGTPAVDLSQTTLSENDELFTHLSHLFSSDPSDAQKALAAAQSRIAAAATHSQLVSQAEASTRLFLVKFLGRLGFKNVSVVFL